MYYLRKITNANIVNYINKKNKNPNFLNGGWGFYFNTKILPNLLGGIKFVLDCIRFKTDRMELILEKELQNFEPFKGINFLLVKYTVINYLSKLERILHIPYNPVKKVKGFYIYLYHKKAELIGIKKLLNGISPGNTIISHKDAKKMVHDIVKLNTFLEHVHYFHQRGLKKELKLMISDAFDIEFLIRKNTIFKNSNHDSDQELIDFANDISMNNYRSHNESI